MTESKHHKDTGLRSDPPPEDLRRERDTFIQQFFRRGAQISEELLADIERLRDQVRALEQDNGELRARIAHDTAIKEMLAKIERLEAEKVPLVARSVSLPPQRQDEFSNRFAELESELSNLGMLHIANLQLHASTTVRRAFKSIRELMAQFLGAEQFALYWDAEERYVPISVDGLSKREAQDFQLDETSAAATVRRNHIWVDHTNPAEGTVARPAVVIPIAMHNLRLGLIVIFRTLPQKTEFSSADHELFKLLSTQAAPSLVHAHLFSEAGRRAPGVQAFIDQED